MCVSHRIGAPATTLKPGGRHLEGRLVFICNTNFYCLAIIHIPGSGGLRTRAEKFRPPGLKTDAGASGKWLFGFSPEGGIGTAGVRKPPDWEHASLLLSPEGDT